MLSSNYKRLNTIPVKVGDLIIGGASSIKIQTMVTTDTLDTEATISQSIRCIEAGAELVRITAPSKKEAENLLHIKNQLKQKGYHTPLIADIHFTPNAAEIAARIVEKVRINPGNYIDKKKFEFVDYSDLEYKNEIEKIRNKFLPLIKICKEYGTAMRIGTNHGSLSDRIMSRYGDTPIGMVESALEFLRIAVDENYNQIVLSMKSSNPIVMVQAYRLLVQKMQEEFSFCFPLHLGVTEAGDGEEGRIKSAIGIGTLLEEGIGDTIRVSLTEDPEFEISVCKDIVARYDNRQTTYLIQDYKINFNYFEYNRAKTKAIFNIGEKKLPIVIADLKTQKISYERLEEIGYHYEANTDKWNIRDDAADYILLNESTDFDLPKSLKSIVPYHQWKSNLENIYPLFSLTEWQEKFFFSNKLNFVLWQIDNQQEWEKVFAMLEQENNNVVLWVYSKKIYPYLLFRKWFNQKGKIDIPVVIHILAYDINNTLESQLIHYATEAGALFLDGFGDGICLSSNLKVENSKVVGRTYIPLKSIGHFLNNTAFFILQATRVRISKTEYISCPSCGRTLFDLQETTSKIRNATKHLKGVKIAIMGCIVNGPGEMADADFGYVGSGENKIHLYKGKEIVRKNIASQDAVGELINLIKENGAWND